MGVMKGLWQARIERRWAVRAAHWRARLVMRYQQRFLRRHG